MRWYLWLIFAYSLIGFIFVPLVYNKSIKQSLGAVVGSLVLRPLIIWGLTLGGAPMALLVILAVAHFLDVLSEAGNVGSHQRVGGGTVLWNLLLWGLTGATVIVAAS